MRLSEEPAEKARLSLFYSVPEAVAVAEQASVGDVFCDAQGNVLTRTVGDDGSTGLEALGSADPDDLQRCLMDELRRAATCAAPGGRLDAEVERVLCWLYLSPGPGYTLDALGLAEHDNGRHELTIKSRPCKKCSAMQKLCRDDCCPD